MMFAAPLYGATRWVSSPPRNSRGHRPLRLSQQMGAGIARLVEVVSSRPKAGAYRVRLLQGKIVEVPIPTRYLGDRPKKQVPRGHIPYRQRRNLVEVPRMFSLIEPWFAA